MPPDASDDSRELIERSSNFTISLLSNDESWADERTSHRVHHTVLRPLPAAADECWAYGLKRGSQTWRAASDILTPQRGKLLVNTAGDPITGRELFWNAHGGKRGTIAITVPIARFPAEQIFPGCREVWVFDNYRSGHTPGAIKYAQEKLQGRSHVVVCLPRNNGTRRGSRSARGEPVRRALRPRIKTIPIHAPGGVMKTSAWVLGVAFVLAGCQPRVISVVDAEPIESPDAGTDERANQPDADFQVSWSDAAAQPTSTSDAGAPTCGSETFELKPRPVELMLILDRSGSMNEPAAPGALTTKWVDVTSALDEAMLKTDQQIQWGMKAFPTNQVQCGVADGVEVPSAPMNYASVRTQILNTTPLGDGTPTTLAIQKALVYLAAHPSPNPRYLVVATDGQPNCRAGGGRSGATDEAGAVLAVSDALRAGLKTFVIGVATGAGAEAVLSDMARAGGAPRAATPPYYPVTSRADLIGALGQITSLVTDCVFNLTKAPPSPDDVNVSVGGAAVARDGTHADGWDYGASGTSIQLYGPACEQVKKTQSLRVIFGCPPIN